MYSSVFYPSLQEIWPELYDMPNVQAVEVRSAMNSIGVGDQGQGSRVPTSACFGRENTRPFAGC